MPTPSGYCGGDDGSTPYGDFMQDADTGWLHRLANMMNAAGRGNEFVLAVALVIHEAFKQGFTCGFEAVNSECCDYLDMLDAINYVCRVMDLPDMESCSDMQGDPRTDANQSQIGDGVVTRAPPTQERIDEIIAQVKTTNEAIDESIPFFREDGKERDL